MTKSSQRLITAATACLAFFLVVSPYAIAQDDPRAKPTTSGFIGGVHYGVPLKWSIALGYTLPGNYNGWRPFVAGEPGIGGWRAGVGALKMTNGLGGGYVARATVLRTGNKAWRAPAQATYVGPELQFIPIFAIGVRLGGFVRVGGKGDGRDLLTGDLSVMF